MARNFPLWSRTVFAYLYDLGLLVWWRAAHRATKEFFWVQSWFSLDKYRPLFENLRSPGIFCDRFRLPKGKEHGSKEQQISQSKEGLCDQCYHNCFQCIYIRVLWLICPLFPPWQAFRLYLGSCICANGLCLDPNLDPFQVLLNEGIPFCSLRWIEE